MIALNDTSIFVGQIKQILHDFNLPLCRIGNNNLTPNSYYIHNNMIYYYTEARTSVACYEYDYNVPYLNITANFNVENMLYDRATHVYLGKYLRFLRDFQGLNLMSMYNCFDGSFLDYDISFMVLDTLVEFNSKNKDYVVYKIPVSFVPEYSISLHNTKNIEICLYDEADFVKSDSDPSKYQLCKGTYQKVQINGVFYYKPGDLTMSLSNNLYMLIKVPKDLNTSIVVLEGKYYTTYNKLNVLPKGEEPDLTTFKIASQLLSTENTYGNRLLGDRILEYLTGAVICKLSEPYDIKRMQLAIDSFYRVNTDMQPKIEKTRPRIYGIWDDHDVEIIKYLAMKHNVNHDLIKYDFLGYVDKDIETYFIANTDFDNIEFNTAKEKDDSVISI